MRIGVDATCWANGRGYGRFTRSLLAEMAALAPDDEFICFLDPVAAQGFDLAGPNVRPVIVPMGVAPTAAAAADGYRAPLDMLRLTRAVWRERPDVFFSPSVYTYFPLPPGQRAVVTVHDAIVAHGGEADPARLAYQALPAAQQRALQVFLLSLTRLPLPEVSP